jgi:hypothetical protein
MLVLSGEGKLVIDPCILAVKQFRDIWEADKDKTKAKTYSLFTGLYLLYNPESPYKEYPEAEKVRQVEEQYLKPYKVKFKDENYQELGRQYLEFLKTTPSQYLLEAAKEKVYDIANFIKKTPLSAGRDGNILQIINTMEKMVKIFASYDTLKKAIETEKLNMGSKRGNGEQGYDEE